MIGYLTGELKVRYPGEVIIVVSGVGYRVNVSAETASKLGELDEVVSVHTHHHIRESEQKLFGFMSLEDRLTFETLLSAHGVGPSLAMAVLDTLGNQGLQSAVMNQDLQALCRVPGVGKKTAQRLIVELSNKIDLTTIPASSEDDQIAPNARQDLADALTSLGYSPEEIAAALKAVPDEGDINTQIRNALAAIAF